MSAMYHIIEKNERRNRQSAVLLAITLHLALVALIYFQAGTKPAAKADTAQIVAKTAPVKTRPLLKP